MAAYLLIFFSAPEHWDWLRLLLLPETIVLAWFGNLEQPLSCVDRLPVLAIAGLLLAVGYSLGRGLLLAIRLPAMDRVEHAAYCLGLGLSVMSNYTLCLGLAGKLQERTIVLLPLLITGLVSALIWRRHPRRSPPESAAPSCNRCRRSTYVDERARSEREISAKVRSA